MKRIETIKDKKVFNNIIRNGKILKTPYFNIYYIESVDNNSNSNEKFGVAVSKKIGNAVIRNKQKRRVRNIIDNNKNLFKKDRNYIIMIKKESLSAKFDIINECMKNLLEKEKNEKEK